MKFGPQRDLYYDSLFVPHRLSFRFIWTYGFLSRLFVLFFIPYPFIAEFSHLGFTYTTYTAVKEDFLIS